MVQPNFVQPGSVQPGSGQPGSGQSSSTQPSSIVQQVQDHLQGQLHHYQQLAALPSPQGSTAPSPDASPEPSLALRAKVQGEIDRLILLCHKLEQRLFTIAAFGLVSRGKSAVLNGLMGQKLLQTGPLNGVTRWPRTVRWLVPPGADRGSYPIPEGLQVELIDTPGLDEIEGQSRTAMAQQVAQQADLILFIVAGDLTRTEYQAIADLLEFQKPLLLVFNKVDLYPVADRSAIVENLRQFLRDAAGNEAAGNEAAGNEAGSSETAGNGAEGNDTGANPTSLILSAAEVVEVAAEPTPLQVRVEDAQGNVSLEWETPEPQMGELRQRLGQVLHQEGAALLALNGLVQARTAEEAIAQQRVQMQQQTAEQRLGRLALAKALAVGLCPWGLGDLLGGAVLDLVAVRNLARGYGLPMTSYGVGAVWQRWLLSGGLLLLAEGLSQGLLGMGSLEGTGLVAAGGGGVVQGLVAAYGCYGVGRSAQVYLREGCTWGPQGSSTLIQAILHQSPPHSLMARLKSAVGPRPSP